MNRLAGQSDIDAVRGATDLVRLIGEHVALRPKGREHVGLCPFHDDKNPSFAVVTHKGNAFYKCHACGAGGDAFDFVMNYHRMEFGEALRFLADRAGVTLQPRRREQSLSTDSSGGGSSRRAELRKANAFAATFFQRTLNDEIAGRAARQVIAQRGVSDDMVQAFMLGAAPDQWDALLNRLRRQALDEHLFASAGLLKPRKEGEGFYDAFRNRLIFPICDDLGNPIAFGARKIDPQDEPKYLNSAESPLFSKSKTLYGLHRAKRAIIDARQAIVTEGYTDVIACHQAGICNVVGTLGTALTREHARLLARLCETVILVFDGDEAGQKAADRGLEAFFAEPVDVKICVLPDELDPDELLKRDDGRAQFEHALRNSIDALQYKISRFRAQLATAAGLSGRQKRLEAFLAELANLGFSSMQGVRKSLVMAHLSEMLGVSVGDIEAAMPRPQRGDANRIAAPAEAQVDAPALADRDAPSEPVACLPARRRAEQDVLAILIYQPELHAQAIPWPGGRAATVAEALSLSHFVDPITRTLAQCILVHFQRGATFTVQELLFQLEHPQAKAMASSLYFDGERLCERSGGSAAETLAAAALSLMAHINLHEYHETVMSFRQVKDEPGQALLAAQSVIEQRRRQGKIPAAIGRGVRT